MSDSSKSTGQLPDDRVRQQRRGVPFAQIPDELICDTAVSAGAVRLWALLQRYANGGGIAWPGQDTLAEHLGVSERSIQNYIRELSQTGWLTVERTFRSGRKAGNIYTVNWDRHDTQKTTSAEDDDTKNSAGRDTKNFAGLYKNENQDEQEPTSPPRVPPKPKHERKLSSTAESGWIREVASEEFTRRHGYAPPELIGRKGDNWESAIADLIVKDKVPVEAVEEVARKVWDYEFHASRFLNTKKVRESFTAALTAVRSRPRGGAARQATDKSRMLREAAQIAREKEAVSAV